ncbi:ribonuclease H-like domain-containing protein [Tanacetum coccineum]
MGVDNRRITLIVIRARANSAVVVSLMEFVLVVLMEMEIKSIFQLRTLLINLQFIYPEPDYSLDFNSPQDLHNLQQQNLCCENIASTKVDRIYDEVLEGIHSIPPGIDSFDAESDLVESVLNQDISIDSSPKIDSLFQIGVRGELIHSKSFHHKLRKLNLNPDSFDDLYNNLRVFESDIKGSTASSSSPQNVAFVSENTSSTNDVSTAYSVPNLSGQNSMYEQTSSYSLLANQSSCPQLDHEDLEQIDEYDLEEMDLKWQVAMISMRMKKFYKKTGRKLQFDAKEPVGFDKTKVECYNCHKTGHFARECRIKGTQDNRRRDAWNSGNKDGSRTGQKEDSKALVTIDGEGVDWTNHSEDEDYALMACNSSDSDTEMITDVLTYHKKLLPEAQKEKDDLKAKVEKWHHSSKNLGKLLNSEMSVL